MTTDKLNNAYIVSCAGSKSNPKIILSGKKNKMRFPQHAQLTEIFFGLWICERGTGAEISDFFAYVS